MSEELTSVDSVTSAADAFASPFEYKGTLFPILSMVEYGILERAFRGSLRDRVRSSLNANKVPTDKHLNYLLDLEYRLVTLDEVKQYVMTSEGALKCIELSLKKAKKDDAEIAKIKENIPTWDAVKIALEVSTFEAMFREKLAEQKKFEAEREAEQRAKEEAADQPAA